MAERYPAIDGLFTWPSEEPRLIGVRCDDCGTLSFPKSAELHRPNCPGETVSEMLFSRRGTLVSWTVQRYAPPPPYVSDPATFQPFAIGTVALPEGIQIPGQLTGIDIDDDEDGIEVELVVDTLYEDDEGCQVLTWKFAPVTEGSAA